MSELSAPARLGAFAAALLVVLAAAFGVGRVTGDVEQATSDVDQAPVSETRMTDHGEGSS